MTSKANLCTACAGITLEALSEPDGYTHLENALDLLASAKTCDLCRLIRQSMDQDATEPRKDDRLRLLLGSEPISLHGIGNNLPSEDEPVSEIFHRPELYGINVHIPDKESGYDVAYLSLFADADSTASLNGDISGRRLFADPGSAEAMQLLKQWYTTCIAEHAECNETFSGARSLNVDSRLPSRVLDLGESGDSQNIRLFITKGTSAPYAALSHCWGKQRLLITTIENLAEHCNMIGLAALPKTFRDAVAVARYLGLRYLWIDSLCIVQNDPEDWRKESVQMGRIYQDAAVTIAASGAHDSSEGCFLQRPPPRPVVTLPYSKNAHEQIFVSLFPDQSDSNLGLAPLGGRAWITQEWMLSPRTIHYTKGKMVWACRTHMKGEDGYTEPPQDEQRLFDSVKLYRESKTQDPTNIEIKDDFFSDWSDMVSTYTSRSLTFEADKPIAILGLATEVSRSVGGSYTSGMIQDTPGLQSEDDARYILAQLFWFAKVALTRPKSLQHQPSWSWTSTMGAVSFLPLVQTARSWVTNLQLHLGSSPDGTHTTESTFGYAQLTTQIKAWDKDISWPGGFPPTPSPGTMSTYSESLKYKAGGVNSQSLFSFLGPTQRPAGWAVFDLGHWPTQEVRLFMALISVSEMDGQTDGFNVMFLEEVQNEGKSRHFRRLGVGEVIDTTWFDSTEAEEITLL